MSYHSSTNHRAHPALAATVIGLAVLVAGPASAESMVGDQSFKRAGERAAAAKATVKPAPRVTRAATDWSMPLPAGIDIETVEEYPAEVSRIDEVQLRKATLAPGATLANFTVSDQLYCVATEGEITVIDHTRGTTATYSAGDHWTDPPGTYTFINSGAVEHAHYFYSMVAAPVEAWQPVGHRRQPYMGKL